MNKVDQMIATTRGMIGQRTEAPTPVAVREIRRNLIVGEFDFVRVYQTSNVDCDGTVNHRDSDEKLLLSL